MEASYGAGRCFLSINIAFKTPGQLHPRSHRDSQLVRAFRTVPGSPRTSQLLESDIFFFFFFTESSGNHLLIPLEIFLVLYKVWHLIKNIKNVRRKTSAVLNFQLPDDDDDDDDDDEDADN